MREGGSKGHFLTVSLPPVIVAIQCSILYDSGNADIDWSFCDRTNNNPASNKTNNTFGNDVKTHFCKPTSNISSIKSLFNLKTKLKIQIINNCDFLNFHYLAYSNAYLCVKDQQSEGFGAAFSGAFCAIKSSQKKSNLDFDSDK